MLYASNHLSSASTHLHLLKRLEKMYELQNRLVEQQTSIFFSANTLGNRPESNGVHKTLAKYLAVYVGCIF